MRHQSIEIRFRQSMLGSRWDGSAGARSREPEPLKMLLRERHRGVETDDRKHPCYVDDRLNDCFTNFRIEVIQLRSIVPGKGRSIVAVIDVTRVAVVAI